MDYELFITERAEELLDNILDYLINILKNIEAARSLLKEIDNVYHNIISNPWMYTYAQIDDLRNREYRKARISRYDYFIVYRIDEQSRVIYIMGFFHDLELYEKKLESNS